jgi:transcriptional regulator with XRE-family HTH domain
MTEVHGLPNLRRVILQRAKRTGSQRRLATVLGVSPSYLTNVLSGRDLPGDTLLDALGFVRRVRYVQRPAGESARAAHPTARGTDDQSHPRHPGARAGRARPR